MDWDPDKGHPNRGRILAISCLSLVLVVLAVSSLNVAIPTLVQDLQPTSSELLWIVDSYALVFAGTLLLAGAVGDRWGRKGALLSGLTVFGLGAVASSFATSPEMLIATRAVMGLGAAFVMPATLSIITSVYPPAERQKAIAVWAGFAGAGGALGPILSGLVLQLRPGDWEAVFLINVPFVLGTMVAVALGVPTSRDSRLARIDWVGAILSVVGLGSLLMGIIQGPESGWGSPIVVGSFVLSAVTTVVFVFWELRIDDPMLDPRFFRIRAFSTGAGVITAFFFGMFGMFFILTQYLQFVRGYSPLLAGVATLPGAVTMVIVAPRSAALSVRFGARNVVAVGGVFSAVGFATFAMLEQTSPYLMIAAGLILLFAGVALGTAPATAAIVTSLPLDKAGVASAMNDATREVGGALGIAIMGTVLTSRYTAVLTPDVPEAAPPEAQETVLDGIGGAIAVAEQTPPSVSEQLLASANEAFVSGMSLAFWGCVVLMALVAVGAAVLFPRELEVSAGH